MDDSRIVDLFLARDELAIRHTSEKYGKRLYSLSFRIVEDRETAEECENDAYLAAWDAIPPNEPRDYLFPFLARIIRHLSLNCCRDRSRLKRSAFISELSAEMEQCIPAPDSCESKLDDMVLKEAINGFLSGLDPEKRTLFLRRYWFLEPVASISDRMGISESKVKTTLLRCREKLKQYLEKEGYVL